MWLVYFDHVNYAVTVALGAPICFDVWYFIYRHRRDSWVWRAVLSTLLAATFTVVPFSPCQGTVYVPAVLFVFGGEGILLGLLFGVTPILVVGACVSAVWSMVHAANQALPVDRVPLTVDDARRLVHQY